MGEMLCPTCEAPMDYDRARSAWTCPRAVDGCQLMVPCHEKPARFFEDVDNSSHHFLVPVAKRAEWIAWRDLPEDDENGWDAPPWATRIDGGTLTFTDPKIERLS